MSHYITIGASCHREVCIEKWQHVTRQHNGEYRYKVEPKDRKLLSLLIGFEPSEFGYLLNLVSLKNSYKKLNKALKKDFK